MSKHNNKIGLRFMEIDKLNEKREKKGVRKNAVVSHLTTMTITKNNLHSANE